MRVPPIDPTCHRAPDDGSTPVADKKNKTNHSRQKFNVSIESQS